MNRLFPIAAVVVLGTALVQGALAINRRTEEIDRLRAQTLAAETGLATLRRALDATAHEAQLAARQLDELNPPHLAPASETHPTRVVETAGWIARVKHVRNLFERHPDHKIYELRLLDDADWLRLTHRLKFENEMHGYAALHAVRQAATARYAPRLQAALDRYADTFPGQTPATIHALAPFFADPADAAGLDRFEITTPPRDPTATLPGADAWQLRKKPDPTPNFQSSFLVAPSRRP